MPILRKITLPARNSAFWRNEEKQIERAIKGPIQRSILQGVLEGYKELDKADRTRLRGKDFISNAKASAAAYAKALAVQLTNTTYKYAETTATIWEKSKAPPSDFNNALKALFGKSRAELIAITETTVAIQQGKELVWAFAGISTWKWITSQDEMVCAVCGSLNDKTFNIGDDTPPAHPRCRCNRLPS